MQSAKFTRLIAVLGILVIALAIFWAGMAVGYRQAQFSSRWGDHYRETFGGPSSPFMMPFSVSDNDDIRTANGAAGQVIGINLPRIAVKGPDEAEKIVVLGSDTVIRRFRDPATTTDIALGDMMIAIGSPDEQGRIVATFVRIVPPPTGFSASNTPSGMPTMKRGAY